MSDAIEWRWVDVSGEQHAVRQGELVDALAGGSLPRFILVWRAGLADWAPAEDVPEFGTALGVLDPVTPDRLPRLDPKAIHPPAPPLGRYAAPLAGRTPTTLLQRKAPTTPPPPPPRGDHPKRAPLGPPAPRVPIPVRDVQPTLADQDLPVRSPTLRPAGALPPPPRTVPLQARTEPFGTENDSKEPHADARSKSLPPPLPPTAGSSKPPAHALVAADPPPPSAPVSKVRRIVTIATLAGLVWPGTALVTFLIAKRTAPPPPVREVLGPVGGVLIRPSEAGCTLPGSAQKLADTSYVGVPPIPATAPGGDIAIGFAESKEHAAGITVSADLTSKRVFDQAGWEPVIDVVPLVATGTLSFHVDRGDTPLHSARTVDGAKPFSIGATEEGVSRAVEKETELLWPSKAKPPTITPPRVVPVAGTGYLVAFRTGGQEGKILVGWLDPEGKHRTELHTPETTATLVGTPSIAVSDKTAIVTYAAKVDAADPWHVEIARFEVSDLPDRTVTFAVPPGGPGTEAIAPYAEGLARSRFLLQWTEGAAGNRAVRTEVLSRDLVVIGDPITLSSPDQNAGQGALSVQGDRAVALFFVKGETSHALWGASLRCP